MTKNYLFHQYFHTMGNKNQLLLMWLVVARQVKRAFHPHSLIEEMNRLETLLKWNPKEILFDLLSRRNLSVMQVIQP